MTIPSRPLAARAALLAIAAATTVLAACSSGSKAEGETASEPAVAPGAFAASIASYDLAANRDERLIVGVSGPDGKLVSYGTATFSLRYLGTKDAPVNTPEADQAVSARFVLVPGQKAPAGAADQGARLVDPSEGIGVYAAEPVRFDEPGFWEVAVNVTLDGKDVAVTGSFEVHDNHLEVAEGDKAPATVNPLAGDPQAPPKAVDSRADGPEGVPDPELHAVTIADALAQAKPLVVVVSTPVYCVSRFCGPVTDAVSSLAKQSAGKANFVHLEVWRDFETTTVNKSAAEWIFRTDSPDLSEPWVFVVDRNGTVAHRFDNVASEADLLAALQSVLA